jgi:hypothetical protein
MNVDRDVLAEDVMALHNEWEPPGELLPVLWSASSPWAELLEASPHRTVAAGRLHVARATVAQRPNGRVGMDHLTHYKHRQLGGVPFDDLLREAYATLTVGLGIDGYRSDGDDLLTLHRDGAPIAAAVTLPDFHEQMAGLIGAPRLVVGLHCPQQIVVASVDSVLAPQVERMVLESDYPDSELVPSVLLMEPDGIRLVAQRS